MGVLLCAILAVWVRIDRRVQYNTYSMLHNDRCSYYIYEVHGKPERRCVFLLQDVDISHSYDVFNRTRGLEALPQ